MFKNIKVSGKIPLMIAVVALPLIAATLYATIKGFNKDIDFALQEQKGNAFLTPLEGLLDALPERQWLVESAARGDHEAETALAAKSTEIDRMFAELNRVNSENGHALQFTEEGLARAKNHNANPAAVVAA